MKEYRFRVDLCGGYTDGFITVKADDEGNAYDKATEYVGKKLYEAFPELDIEYNVEVYEEYDTEEDE